MEEDLASIGDMGDQIKQMESKQKAALKKQNAIPTNRVLPPKSSREDDAGGDLLARAKLLCAAASEMEAANADIISTFKANLGVADDAPAPKTGKRTGGGGHSSPPKSKPANVQQKAPPQESTTRGDGKWIKMQGTVAVFPGSSLLSTTADLRSHIGRTNSTMIRIGSVECRVLPSENGSKEKAHTATTLALAADFTGQMDLEAQAFVFQPKKGGAGNNRRGQPATRQQAMPAQHSSPVEQIKQPRQVVSDDDGSEGGVVADDSNYADDAGEQQQQRQQRQQRQQQQRRPQQRQQRQSPPQRQPQPQPQQSPPPRQPRRERKRESPPQQQLQLPPSDDQSDDDDHATSAEQLDSVQEESPQNIAVAGSEQTALVRAISPLQSPHRNLTNHTPRSGTKPANPEAKRAAQRVKQEIQAQARVRDEGLAKQAKQADQRHQISVQRAKVAQIKAEQRVANRKTVNVQEAEKKKADDAVLQAEIMEAKIAKQKAIAKAAEDAALRLEKRKTAEDRTKRRKQREDDDDNRTKHEYYQRKVDQLQELTQLRVAKSEAAKSAAERRKRLHEKLEQQSREERWSRDAAKREVQQGKERDRQRETKLRLQKVAELDRIRIHREELEQQAMLDWYRRAKGLPEKKRRFVVNDDELELACTYRVTAEFGIGVRHGPGSDAERTGTDLVCGEVFDAVPWLYHGEVVRDEEQRNYLKLLDGRGWVFDLGKHGEFYRRPIIEEIGDDGLPLENFTINHERYGGVSQDANHGSSENQGNQQPQCVASPLPEQVNHGNIQHPQASPAAGGSDTEEYRDRKERASDSQQPMNDAESKVRKGRKQKKCVWHREPVPIRSLQEIKKSGPADQGFSQNAAGKKKPSRETSPKKKNSDEFSWEASQHKHLDEALSKGVSVAEATRRRALEITQQDADN